VLEIVFIVSFMTVLIFFAAVPVSDPVPTVAEAKELHLRLGISSVPGYIPVVVFFSPGCPACSHVEKRLQVRGIVYHIFNIRENQVANQIHAYLGRGYLGTTVTRATPTILVGRKVFRGSAVTPIEEALREQVGQF
jgi:glutaredoxin